MSKRSVSNSRKTEGDESAVKNVFAVNLLKAKNLKGSLEAVHEALKSVNQVKLFAWNTEFLKLKYHNPTGGR